MCFLTDSPRFPVILPQHNSPGLIYENFNATLRHLISTLVFCFLSVHVLRVLPKNVEKLQFFQKAMEICQNSEKSNVTFIFHCTPRVLSKELFFV